MQRIRPLRDQEHEAIPTGDTALLQQRKKICLFGLSADPPTGYGGHVGIVQTLQQQRIWDEVWVMPVYRHTFKVRKPTYIIYYTSMSVLASTVRQQNF
jgi:hypothetical protein